MSFQNLPDQSGVRYMASTLERAFRDEAQALHAVRREGERLVEAAERAADGREYREISRYNPDPVEQYNAAVTRTKTLVEAFRAASWASMLETETAETASVAFDEWVGVCRANALASIAR